MDGWMCTDGWMDGWIASYPSLKVAVVAVV